MRGRVTSVKRVYASPVVTAWGNSVKALIVGLALFSVLDTY